MINYLKVNSTKKQFLKWGNHAIFAISDHGIFSGTNFISGLLLARWLDQENYGLFSIIFSLFLFFSGIPSAFIWEPMTVFGSSEKDDHFREYFQNQLTLQFLVTFILSLSFTVFYFSLKNILRYEFIIASAIFPFLLLVWFFRQVCYIKFKPTLALIISSIYAISHIFLLGFFVSAENLNVSSFLIIWAFSSVIASIFAIKILGIWPRVKITSHLRKIVRENWSFGRYIFIASMASGITNFLYLPLLGYWINISEAGAYKALQNLILPGQQVITAFTVILLPQLSRYVYSKPKEIPRKLFLIPLIVIIIFVVLYLLVLLVSGREFMHLIYRNGFYDDYVWILPYIGIGFFFTSLAQMLAIYVRALRETKAILWSKIYAALFVLSIGVFLTWKWGIAGVVLSVIVAATIEAYILSVKIRSSQLKT